MTASELQETIHWPKSIQVHLKSTKTDELTRHKCSDWPCSLSVSAFRDPDDPKGAILGHLAEPFCQIQSSKSDIGRPWACRHRHCALWISTKKYNFQLSLEVISLSLESQTWIFSWFGRFDSMIFHQILVFFSKFPNMENLKFVVKPYPQNGPTCVTVASNHVSSSGQKASTWAGIEMVSLIGNKPKLLVSIKIFNHYLTFTISILGGSVARKLGCRKIVRVKFQSKSIFHGYGIFSLGFWFDCKTSWFRHVSKTYHDKTHSLIMITVWLLQRLKLVTCLLQNPHFIPWS